MGKFLDIYNSVSKSEYEETAFKMFVTNIMQNKETGAGKGMTLMGMDMESQTPLRFVPSMFYTFMYASENIDLTDNSSFIDAVPLILCTSADGSGISGINFNLIPNNLRASVIDIIYEAFPDFYDHLRGDFVINEDFAKYLITSLPSFIKLVKTKTGINISGAVRHYNSKYILSVRMIEYDQWEYIPFLVFKDAVRGMNLAAVQKSLLGSAEK